MHVLVQFVCGVVWCGVVWCGVIGRIYNVCFYLFLTKLLDHLLGGVEDVIQHRGRYYWKVRLSFKLGWIKACLQGMKF
jgi:hypothetical protein